MRASEVKVGDVFAKLTIVGPPIRKERRPWFPMRCECGNEKVIMWHRVARGYTRSCGCAVYESRVLRPMEIGERHGRLVVTGRGRKGRVLAACDCGAPVREYCLGNLRVGKTTSCGCRAEESGANLRTHGLSDHPLFSTWYGMIRRCHEPVEPAFRFYGARGIAVCTRWRSDPAAFFADMGERPAGHSIDRIDNDRGYDCGRCDDCVSRRASLNCRWATRREQAVNTRRNVYVEYEGERWLVSDLYKKHGVKRQTFSLRIRAGWPLIEAATTPPQKRRGRIGLAALPAKQRKAVAAAGREAAKLVQRRSLRERIAESPRVRPIQKTKRYAVGDEWLTMAEIMKRSGMPRLAIYARLRRGASAEQILAPRQRPGRPRRAA